jgi:hypothetical protein
MNASLCLCLLRGIKVGGGVDMAFLKHVPLNVEAMFSIVLALLIQPVLF